METGQRPARCPSVGPPAVLALDGPAALGGRPGGQVGWGRFLGPSEPHWLPRGPEEPPLGWPLCVFILVSASPFRGLLRPSLSSPATTAAAVSLGMPGVPGLSPSSAAPASALSPAVVTGLTRKLSFRLLAHQATGQEQAFRRDSGSGLTPEITLLHLPTHLRLPGSRLLSGESPPADRSAAPV